MPNASPSSPTPTGLDVADFQAIVASVTYKSWYLYIGTTNGVPYLQVQFIAPCPVTGTRMVQKGRKWQLSPFMTPSEVVATAWLAVQRAELHEAAEAFLYKGVAVKLTKEAPDDDD